MSDSNGPTMDPPVKTFADLLSKFKAVLDQAIYLEGSGSLDLLFTPVQVKIMSAGAFCSGFQSALAMIAGIPESQADQAGAIIMAAAVDCAAEYDRLSSTRGGGID